MPTRHAAGPEAETTTTKTTRMMADESVRMRRLRRGPLPTARGGLKKGDDAGEQVPSEKNYDKTKKINFIGPDELS
jgi:hypothetical protein